MTTPAPTFARRTALLAATLTVAFGLGACSTSIDGQSTAAPASSGTAASSSTEVNPAALDTGTYATDPQPTFGNASRDQLPAVESQRMAEFTTLPSEVDPAFTEVALPTGVVASLKMLFASQAPVDAAIKNRLAAAFFSSAGTTETARPGGPSLRSITHAVLRFRDPSFAASGARAMYDASLTGRGALSVGMTPAVVRTMPGTLATRSGAPALNGSPATTLLSTYTAHNDYVIIDQVSAPVGRDSGSEALARRALALQAPLIDRFPKTPVGSNPVITVDQDKLLIYTLRNPNAEATGYSDRAVYGPRGMAHISLDPQGTMRVLDEVDSPHTAVWLTTVFRAATAEGGAKLASQLVDGAKKSGYTATESPKGLPIARCVSKDTTLGQRNECYVQVGRYVGSSGDADPAAARQQISAQYLILTKADQNAN